MVINPLKRRQREKFSLLFKKMLQMQILQLLKIWIPLLMSESIDWGKRLQLGLPIVTNRAPNYIIKKFQRPSDNSNSCKLCNQRVIMIIKETKLKFCYNQSRKLNLALLTRQTMRTKRQGRESQPQSSNQTKNLRVQMYSKRS